MTCSPGSDVGLSARDRRARRGQRGVACLLLFVTAVTWARLAPADEASPVEVHLRRAAAAIDLGKHADAAREYESAYMQSRDPALLVHVGQAWQRAGDRGKALTALQSYLRVSPYGEHRAFCETKLRELQQGTAIAVGAQLDRPQGTTALASGVWSATVDFGSGPAPATATFSATVEAESP